MRLVICSFILLILLASVQGGFGQNTPKAILFDEFPARSCDPLLASIDGFLVNLQQEPSATGLIVINGRKGNYPATLSFEQLIRNALKKSQIDANRVNIASGEDEVGLHLQLWNIPAGATEPVYTRRKGNYSLVGISKQFIFTTRGDDDTICPQLADLSFYSKVLLANPNWRARLVIYEPSPRKFRQTETELISELVKDNKVPRSRITTLQNKRKSEASRVEFWLVPTRKRQQQNY